MKLFKNNISNIYMGFIFMLCNITSVVVVTQIMGLNIPLSLLMTGINTLIFHFFTKRCLASVMGISGLYIGAILLITQKFGTQYALGGVVLAGVLYVLFSILMYKYQKQVLNIIPKWLLSFAIVLIGLSLIPIATSLISKNLILGLSTLAIMIFIEFKAKGTTRLFSMPIAILIVTIVNGLINGFTLVESQNLMFTLPKFNLESFLTISLISFAVIFEAMGDCKNTGDIMGIDILNKKGMLGNIFLANGIGTILNGFVGAAPATTYSEQNSAVHLTQYKDTRAELWTAVIFILLAFIPTLSGLILSIPSEIFGGCLLYLYASVVVSAIKQISESGIDLGNNKKVFIIMSVGLGLFFITFIVNGVTISSIAISMVVMILMNIIIKDKEIE